METGSNSVPSGVVIPQARHARREVDGIIEHLAEAGPSTFSDRYLP